jgi:hypothetical protein
MSRGNIVLNARFQIYPFNIMILPKETHRSLTPRMHIGNTVWGTSPLEKSDETILVQAVKRAALTCG